MRQIRVCFEAEPDVAMDRLEDFRAHAEAHLGPVLDYVSWGGFISLDASKTRYHAMEPVWQFVGETRPGLKAELEKLVEAHPVPGYVAHISEDA